MAAVFSAYAPPATSAPASAEKDAAIRRTIETMVGEKLKYSIRIFRVFKVGELTVSLEKGSAPDEYRLVMDAQTTPMVRMFSSFKRSVYRATSGIEGGRLVCRKFEKEIYRDTVVRVIYSFDYATRKMTGKRFVDDVLKKEISRDIPEGRIWDDFLTAAVNFRAGAYGPPVKGTVFSIWHIPTEYAEKFEIGILDAAEEKKLGSDASMIVNIKVQKDIFDIVSREVYVYIDAGMIPVRGVIMDAVSFGDITAQLVERRSGEAKTTYPESEKRGKEDEFR